MNQSENPAKSQAMAQYKSVERMVEALDLDWNRLEELREERDACTLHDAEAEELAELEAIAGECKDRDDAEQAIQEDPLSVQVRSGWATPGDALNAQEFEILLCTGGPAVRIVGELDCYGYAQPCRAWMEYQDWGTPWTLFHGASQDVLLAYAGQFFYGE